MSTPEIHISRRGATGHILLDRPAALNAVTLRMVREIARALDLWEHDAAVRCVVVEAVGEKAFSAGGDIRELYQQGRAGDHDAQLAFWREEFLLNARIRAYSKPYVVIIDGIVMGGGVGISLHGSHRIGGDRFLFAMPETGIGLFPDVGSTFILPRLPGRIGTYLGMTGARVSVGDAVAIGLIDAHVPSSVIRDVAPALAEGEEVNTVLARFRQPAPAAILPDHQAVIDRCFDAATPAEVLGRLDEDPGAFATAAARMLREKSPTSLGIVLRQMQRGRGLSMSDAMRLEFRIVSRVCRGHDFLEGVRAAIIDKDGAPRWQPASLADVTNETVEAYFLPLPSGDLPVPS